MARLINLANFQQFAAINVTSDPGYLPGARTIPNTAEIGLQWFQDDGVVAHNVLHGSYQGAFHGTQAECNAILTGLTGGSQWSTLAGFLSPVGNLGAVTIRDLNVPDAPVIASNVSGRPGTSTGTALPNEVAAVLTLRTAFTGPANRGRIYVPIWATNALGTGNIIAAGAVTALGNWGSIIAGVLQSSGYVFGIGHFARQAYTGAGGRQHPARAAGLVPITVVLVKDNHWDTQRRRGLK